MEDSLGSRKIGRLHLTSLLERKNMEDSLGSRKIGRLRLVRLCQCRPGQLKRAFDKILESFGMQSAQWWVGDMCNLIKTFS